MQSYVRKIAVQVMPAVAISGCVVAPAYANNDVEPVDDIEIIKVHGEKSAQSGLGLNDKNTAASRLGLAAVDLPASVSLITKEDIALKGDFSGLSAVTRAAGFAASASPGNGGTSMSVRGFNGHSSVVNTYDGTRLYIGAGAVTFPADTWTVDRVEVLRGPGSVVNGVGAIGATVNYVPKKPTFEAITNELSITGGKHNLQRYAFGSGGKLDEQFAYRFDAVSHSSDGHVHNGDEDRKAVAGSLLFQPSNDVRWQLSVDYANTDAAPYWGTPLIDGKVPESIIHNNYNAEEGLVKYQDLWPRLRLEWQISDAVQLRSETYYLTSKRHWRNIETYDYNDATGMVDRSFYLEILHDQEQVGNRTDVTMDFQLGGMQNRLSVGGEVNQINFTHTNNSPYNGSSSVDLEHPKQGSWFEGAESDTTLDYDTDTLQYAVFVDNVLELNEQWHVVTGLRHDVIDYERQDFARTNGQTEGFIDDKLHGTSWRVGGVFKPTEQASLYAQYSTAVDAIQSILSATDPNLDLAEGKQIEVGLKQSLLEGKLQYTLSLYDITKSDLVSSDPGGIQRQIGEQSSQGAEVQLFWTPTEAFSLEFNGAYTNPEYEEYVSGEQNYTGNTPRNVPEKTANIWASWHATKAWSVAGGVRYVGERYLNDSNTRELPNYTVVDASVDWHVSDSVALALHGKNLTDTHDYVLAPYGNQWILAEGRSFELTLSYDF